MSLSIDRSKAMLPFILANAELDTDELDLRQPPSLLLPGWNLHTWVAEIAIEAVEGHFSLALPFSREYDVAT